MKTETTDVVIVGAGLTGLAIAYYLRQWNKKVIVVEARDRLGGRIFTKQATETASLEMGATWIQPPFSVLQALIQELNIQLFEQEMFGKAIYEQGPNQPAQLVELPSSNPTFRVAGGTNTIIHQLAKAIPEENIFLNQPVTKIKKEADGIQVVTNTHTFRTSIVITTLPPLLLQNIEFEPALPSELSNISNTTHTWMGTSIKVGLTYEKPFWRNEIRSGTIFSNIGPITEMYDHSNIEDNKFALKGFVNDALHTLSKQERLSLILPQLEKYFGPVATEYLSYEEVVWRNEPFTFIDANPHLIPHQNNGHPIFQQCYWENQLFVGGAETAPQFGGYMEGAVRSAIFISNSLKLVNV